MNNPQSQPPQQPYPTVPPTTAVVLRKSWQEIALGVFAGNVLTAIVVGFAVLILTSI